MADAGKKMSKRSKKRKYILNHFKDRRSLAGTIGSRGVVVTGDQYREEDCKIQILSLLDEYADLWFPTETAEKAEGQSVDSLLEQELEKLKSKDTAESRFSLLDTGCKGVLFVRFNDTNIPPTEFVTRIMKDTFETGKKMTKNIARVIPAEISCYAKPEDIEKMARPFIQKKFSEFGPSTYAIVYKARVNESINREEIIKLVASFVPEDFSVNLGNPDITILVEIVKTVFTVSVVQDFHKYSRFNLQEIGVSKESKVKATKSKTVTCPKDKDQAESVENDEGGEEDGHEETGEHDEVESSSKKAKATTE